MHASYNITPSGFWIGHGIQRQPPVCSQYIRRRWIFYKKTDILGDSRLRRNDALHSSGYGISQKVHLTLRICSCSCLSRVGITFRCECKKMAQSRFFLVSALGSNVAHADSLYISLYGALSGDNKSEWDRQGRKDI